MSGIKLLSSNKCFEGHVQKYEHESDVLSCSMKFNIYIPNQTNQDSRFPVGLTCNEDNFITKAGAIQYASKHNLALMCPDTSPRNVNCLNDSVSWDFGQGAGYYCDATEPAYSKHYRMFSYISSELIDLVKKNFSTIDTTRMSIFGHSMGGHGALVIALNNKSLFKSVSAFAPICNPTKSAWGRNAFTKFLGSNEDSWAKYDATRLISSTKGLEIPIFIDQGDKDQFYIQKELLTDEFISVAKSTGYKNLKYEFRNGYDHSYYYIQTFIEEHINFHAKLLK